MEPNQCSNQDVLNRRMVVAVRIRPLSLKEKSEGKESCCQVFQNKYVVIEKAAGKGASVLKTQQRHQNEYAFDQAFGPEAGQAEVYRCAAQSHIPSVLDGYNLTVFAYGATGAGKTHTMMGSARMDSTTSEGTMDEWEISGIIPQSLTDLFKGIEKKQNDDPQQRWTVFVSYLEVYNEQIYDLLSESRGKLDVREDQKKGIVEVAYLNQEQVENTEEVLELLCQGNRRRKTESTLVNTVSSRSHAVLQVIVRKCYLSEHTGQEVCQEAKLSLIDLAGSERAQQNRGERLREGSKINMSLLSLANCINSLAKGEGKPKYRDSKLTHLLKPSLTGNCRIIMIANINPSHQSYEDSHQTLKYADRAKSIKVDAKISSHIVHISHSERETRLLEENKSLRSENNNLLHVKEENIALKKRINELENLLRNISVPSKTRTESECQASRYQSTEYSLCGSELSNEEDPFAELEQSHFPSENSASKSPPNKKLKSPTGHLVGQVFGASCPSSFSGSEFDQHQGHPGDVAQRRATRSGSLSAFKMKGQRRAIRSDSLSDFKIKDPAAFDDANPAEEGRSTSRRRSCIPRPDSRKRHRPKRRSMSASEVRTILGQMNDQPTKHILRRYSSLSGVSSKIPDDPKERPYTAPDIKTDPNTDKENCRSRETSKGSSPRRTSLLLKPQTYQRRSKRLATK